MKLLPNHLEESGPSHNSEADVVEASGAISVKEAGARGGRSTLERRGTEFFREIGTKGGRKRAELYRDLLAEFGRRGGRPRRPNLENAVVEGSPQKKEAMVGPGGPSTT